MATAIKNRAKTRTPIRPRLAARPKTKATKAGGGFITVKVASLPGKVADVVLKKGAATLEQALRGFGMHLDQAQDIRVNNVPVKKTDKAELKEGSFVTVVGQVNGG